MSSLFVFDAPGFERELEAALTSDNTTNTELEEFLDREQSLLVDPADGRPITQWRQRRADLDASALALTRFYDPTADLGVAEELRSSLEAAQWKRELGEPIAATGLRLIRYKTLVLIRKRLIEADAPASLLRQLRIAQASRRGLLLS